MKKEEIDVKEFLESAASIFIPQSEMKGIEFLIGSPDPTFEIYADPSLLDMALTNVLNNALKFTSEGGKIKLGATIEKEKVRLWVQDTGIGIDPEDLPHIFDRFYRGKSVMIEGSGLGLDMVQSIVKVHGGEVSVASEPGIGSTFGIKLPQFMQNDTVKPTDT